ncbi:MAG: 30S ribosomal protein S16 [Spirochaetales bacterium]
MAVKIRLARLGSKKAPFYRLVVADSRAPRDGKFIEVLGNYNPMTEPAAISVNNEKVLEWLGKGAQPTESARAVLVKSGVIEPKKSK